MKYDKLWQKRAVATFLSIFLLFYALLPLNVFASGTEEPPPPAATSDPAPATTPEPQSSEPEPEPEPPPVPPTAENQPYQQFIGGKDYYPAIAGVAAEEFVQPAFDVPCRAAILFEQETGTVLYEKDADAQVPMASITKIMTILLVMDALDSGQVTVSDIVPISEHAFSMGGSQIWLEPGEQMTVQELLKAVVISSANDAAVALAELVGGSEPVFCEMMNQRAAQLGMLNTNFTNACGLDAPGHYSSARDVAIMTSELMKTHPDVIEYTTIWMDYLRGGETQLINTNRLLRSYQGTTGLKTGTTNGAGVCISASVTRGETSLVAVVLGAPSSEERFSAATTLLDFGFANYEMAVTPAPQNAPQSLRVLGGADKEVELIYNLPQKVLVRKGQAGGITAEIDLPESLAAPVFSGSQVGSVKIKSGDTVLGTYPVVVQNGVEKMSMGIALALLTNAIFTI